MPLRSDLRAMPMLSSGLLSWACKMAPVQATFRESLSPYLEGKSQTATSWGLASLLWCRHALASPANQCGICPRQWRRLWLRSLRLGCLRCRPLAALV